MIFVLSVFEWPFYTGFTVPLYSEHYLLKPFLPVIKRLQFLYVHVAATSGTLPNLF